MNKARPVEILDSLGFQFRIDAFKWVGNTIIYLNKKIINFGTSIIKNRSKWPYVEYIECWQRSTLGNPWPFFIVSRLIKPFLRPFSNVAVLFNLFISIFCRFYFRHLPLWHLSLTRTKGSFHIVDQIRFDFDTWRRLCPKILFIKSR